jgi:hypothetical protein
VKAFFISASRDVIGKYEDPPGVKAPERRREPGSVEDMLAAG